MSESWRKLAPQGHYWQQWKQERWDTLATSWAVMEAVWKKRSSKAHYQRKTKNLMDEHQDVDWTWNRNASDGSERQITMEIGCPWSSQPLDQGRLKQGKASAFQMYMICMRPWPVIVLGTWYSGDPTLPQSLKFTIYGTLCAWDFWSLLPLAFDLLPLNKKHNNIIIS